MQISGRTYPDRPPGRGSRLDRAARLKLLCGFLEEAAAHCTEPERRLYKEIRRVQAMAENLRDYQINERLGDPGMFPEMDAANVRG